MKSLTVKSQFSIYLIALQSGQEYLVLTLKPPPPAKGIVFLTDDFHLKSRAEMMQIP